MGPRAFHVVIACLALSAVTAATQSASGQAPAPVDAEVSLAEGDHAEETLDFEGALRHYEAGARDGAGARAGHRAQVRAEYLRARRGPDGTFRDLVAFEEMRRSAQAHIDDESLAAFASLAAAMEAEVVRGDAHFLLGEAYLRRRGRPAAAVTFYEEVIASPAATPARRRTATVALAEARAASGDRAAAVMALEEAGLGERLEAPQPRNEETRRRARALAAATLLLSLCIILVVGRPQVGVLSSARALRRRHLFVTSYVLVIPAVIAALYDPQVIWGFVLLGVGALGLLFAAFASARSLRRRSARPAALSVVFGATVFALGAVAWLSLDAVDGLGSFGFP